TSVTIEKLEQLGYVIEPKIETDSIAVTAEAVKRGMALIGSAQLGDLFQNISFRDNYTSIEVLQLPADAVAAYPYHG
ncbi:hypothetical protein, partial [Kiloniella majae]|uniref:hypothetical protein n=1 Tax=Kiloniella majae TaxID=1938558 RepID=UPI001C3FBA38